MAVHLITQRRLQNDQVHSNFPQEKTSWPILFEQPDNGVRAAIRGQPVHRGMIHGSVAAGSQRTVPFG